MEKTYIKQLNANPQDFAGKQVKVCGWIKSVRNSKDFGFATITDGTCFKPAQVIFDAKLDNYQEIAKLNAGSTVIVTGEVKLTPENKQPYEILASNFEIFKATDNEYPLQKKYHSVEFLRNIAYLRPRSNLFQAVFRIRSVAAMAIHTYFQKNGYIYVNTPLITTADCEGSDQMFKVTTLNLNDIPKTADGKADMTQDLFGKQAYITGSGQLHGEAFALAFNKIYTFGPTFRTENSNTKYHANEFWMIEPEIAFCDLEELMDIEEDMLKSVVQTVLTECKDELEFLDNFVEKGLIEKLTKLVSSKFTRIDHEEVIKILQKADCKWEFEPQLGGDIAKEHEKYITEYFGGPVFIKNWPKDIKAYYMKQNADGKTVAAVDLEVPGAGELMGGSQREEDYQKIMSRCKELGVDTSTIDWYLNLRKFGSCIHSGFGMGFERLVMYLTGVDNIRDTIPFPRTPMNCAY